MKEFTLVEPSYAATDVHGSMGYDQKVLHKLLSGSQPNSRCPEFQVSCRLGQELFTLPTYIMIVLPRHIIENVLLNKVNLLWT